jgi:hypothetical protein
VTESSSPETLPFDEAVREVMSRVACTESEARFIAKRDAA